MIMTFTDLMTIRIMMTMIMKVLMVFNDNVDDACGSPIFILNVFSLCLGSARDTKSSSTQTPTLPQSW